MFLENPQEYIGKQYNHTTILQYLGKYRDNTYYYKCKCDCGKEFYIKLRKKDKVRHCCIDCLMNTNRNKKKKITYDYYGETLTSKELSKKLNINYHTLITRIYILKWNKDRWAEPVKRRRNET